MATTTAVLAHSFGFGDPDESPRCVWCDVRQSSRKAALGCDRG